MLSALLPLVRVHLGKRIERGDAGADQRGRVRHAAHELAVAAEPARQRIESHAGGDADHELLLLTRNRGERRLRILRLYREHQNVGALHRRVRRGGDVHRVARAEALARGRAHLDHRDRARVGALGHQPADERGGHVAAAEEGDPHAASFSFFRCAEYRGADAHHGRALGERQLEVVGHAHRQRVEAELAFQLRRTCSSLLR